MAPSSSDVEVGVIGIKALAKDIKHLTDDQQSALYKAIREAGKQAVEPVAARARNDVPHVDVEGQSGTLSGSIRASGTRTGAGVRMGSKAIPWAGWVEFGGRRHAPHESEREFKPKGRYLFPAAVNLAPVAATLYGEAMSHVLATSGVWTNSTDDPEAVHD